MRKTKPTVSLAMIVKDREATVGAAIESALQVCAQVHEEHHLRAVAA